MKVPRVAALAAFALLIPAASEAQCESLAGFLSKVTDIGVFQTTGRITSNSPETKSESHNLDGFGFELSFTIAVDSLPRKLWFSGLSISVGYQIPIK